MKIFSILVIITILALLSSCERCEQHFVLNKNMRLLAEAYQPGNWWIYVNQDSTKFDSVYVTDVKGWNYEPKTVTKCEVEQVGGDFVLQSKYFNEDVDGIDNQWTIVAQQLSGEANIYTGNHNIKSYFAGLDTDTSDNYILFSFSGRFKSVYSDTVLNDIEYKRLVKNENGTPILDLNIGLLYYVVRQDTFKLIDSNLL